MKQIGSLEEWKELSSLYNVHTINRENLNRIIYAHKLYISNRYICGTCPTAVNEALQNVKRFIEDNRKHWEEKIARAEVKEYQNAPPEVAPNVTPNVTPEDAPPSPKDQDDRSWMNKLLRRNG